MFHYTTTSREAVSRGVVGRSGYYSLERRISTGNGSEVMRPGVGRLYSILTIFPAYEAKKLVTRLRT